MLAGILAIVRPALAGADQPNEEDDRRYAGRGISMMMDGDLDGSIVVAQQIQQERSGLAFGLRPGSQRDLVENLLRFRQFDRS